VDASNAETTDYDDGSPSPTWRRRRPVDATGGSEAFTPADEVWVDGGDELTGAVSDGVAKQLAEGFVGADNAENNAESHEEQDRTKKGCAQI